MPKNKLQATLEQYIGKWVNRLGISDYTVYAELCSSKELNGDYAHVQTDEDTRIVNLQFNRQRLLKEPNEIEKTVVHELLHTRLNEYCELVDEMIKLNAGNPKLQRVLEQRAEKLEHKIIVALTDAIMETQEN